MRDLFQALLDENNERKHPIFVVLLHAYCPRMVRWWINGVEPVLSPDPVWMALEDMAAGYNLRMALITRGLDTALEEAYRYVHTVDMFRNNYPGIDAPETTDFFDTKYDQERIRRDFQLSGRVEKEFGSWDGFYAYVRTHAFLFEDWAEGVGFKAETATVEAVTLSIRIPGKPNLPAVRWPAWLWCDEGSPREVVSALALPEAGGQPDPLRFSLLDKADRVDGAWSGVPDTFALNPMAGTVTPFVPPVDKRVLPKVMLRVTSTYYHKIAKNSPYLPLAAFTAPNRCTTCGFRHVCYENDGSLQEEILLG